MINLILIINLLIIPPDYNYTIDFGQNKNGEDWVVVVDGVMGGLSTSSSLLSENTIHFKGNISLENNGGFAALRGPKNNMDYSAYSNLEIRYRSKGQAFGIRFLKWDQFFMPYLKKTFDETSWEWKTVNISLNEFKEYILNNERDKKIDANDFDDISRLGIIVSNKKEGDFELEIDYIKLN
ncbi:MAG: hypothetical protein C0595_04975 [Marinilabiliales bacterium]|nr:MAG: hypothetical protein C0595_04975 [Marinilabiliales bacterium]